MENTRLKRPCRTLKRVAACAALLVSIHSSLLAQTPGVPCKIDPARSGPVRDDEKYLANCFYDDSGNLKYWIFSVRSPEDFSRLTAITGYPAIWRTQQAYSIEGGSPDSTMARDIEREWRLNNQFFDLAPDGRMVPRPNRASPFTPVYKKSLNEYVPFPDVEASIRKQFESWVVKNTMEALTFPRRHIAYYPGGVNFETLRVPLYASRDLLVIYWVRFWKECWAATAKDKTFDGCEAELGDYVLASALEKASTKSYPTNHMAEKAKIIARAIDAARHFHETTSELVRFMNPNKWKGTGVEWTHLEIDDIPLDLREQILKAEREMKTARLRVKAIFIE